MREFFMDKICGRIDAKQEKPENRKNRNKSTYSIVFDF